VTSIPLGDILDGYRSGLEAELRLLKQLKRISDKQSESRVEPAASRARPLVETRDRLMQGLMALEEEIRPMRRIITEQLDVAAQLSGFEKTVLLHREAEQLIVEVIESDQQTLAALENAEQTRRLAQQMVEKGRTTLSAYRRVVTPTPTPASIVIRRG